MSSIETTTVSDVLNNTTTNITMSSIPTLSNYVTNSTMWADATDDEQSTHQIVKENPPKISKPPAWGGSLPHTIVGKKLIKSHPRSVTPKDKTRYCDSYHPFERLLRKPTKSSPIGYTGITGPTEVTDVNNNSTKNVDDSSSEEIHIIPNKYVSSAVRIADTNGDLVLYHYINCDDTSDDIVKSSRGIIRSEDNIICKTFGYTPEIPSTNIDLITSLLPAIHQYKVYDAEEGATLRLYSHNNRWYLSTHRKIDAYHSRWGSSLSQSFGEMFINALEWEIKNGTLKCIIEYENRTDIFDRYCETLDKNRNYTFLVRNSADNRIVCDAPQHPQLYFIGSFDKSTHLLVEGNDSNIITPHLHTFDSVSDLLYHVNNNVKHTLKQGVIVYLNNQTQIKIMNTQYVNYFNARGNEPSIKFRYLQVRNDKDKSTMLYNLYPNCIQTFEKYENILSELGRKIHRAYVNRFINRQYVSLPQSEYFVVQSAHTWHIQDRIHNKISLDKVLEIIDNQPPTSLNRMIKPYLSKNGVVDLNFDDSNINSNKKN